MRPFRFGAALFDEGTGSEWRERAKRIEGLGYSTLLLPDHFVTNYSPVPALTAAAVVTTTLRVGTMVFDNDFRHPAALAKDCATLDVMCEGRLDVGLGAGWHEPEYKATGIPFDAAATRVDRLEESIQILKGLWGSATFSFVGNHYRITEMEGLPRPVQQPHPPIMIGGGGLRMLSLAAREADIVSFAAHVLQEGGVDTNSLTAEGIAERVAMVKERSAGRDIELSNYYSTPAVLDADVDAAAEQVLATMTERWGKPLLTREQLDESPYYLFGDAKMMIDKLVERRERFGFSYICFTDDCERYADVVEALAGI